MIHPFSIPSLELQLFEFGPFRVYIYAICIIVGIAAATIWTGRRLQARGGERGVVLDFMMWALVLGIVGARVYHVLTHWGHYFTPGRSPLEIVAFWNGGIAIFGALLGGALGVLLASRMTGIRFLSFADALVPGMLLAQAIGRLGNWFNHELFGGPTTLPWGLEIESSNPAFPIGLPEGTLFHPTFLYESLWNLLGIVVLLAVERRLRPRWGQFFAMYLVWYGVGRMFVESLRVDPSLVILGLRTNVLAALCAVLLGLVLLMVQRRRHPGIELSVYLPGRSNPEDAVLDETSDPEVYHHVIAREGSDAAEGGDADAADDAAEAAAEAETADDAADDDAEAATDDAADDAADVDSDTNTPEPLTR